jgi:hypothetical protein
MPHRPHTDLYNNLYKLDGKTPVPCPDFVEWAQWYEHADRRVARNRVGPIEVSTIFLGLDHGWGGRRQLFETMAFGDKDTLIELGSKKRLIRRALDFQQRYATWEEAEEGHRKGIAWARSQLSEIDGRLALTKPEANGRDAK